jgi:hypothetical protein
MKRVKREPSDYILDAARQYSGPWLILATLPILYVWLLVFSDGRRANTALWFSLAVVVTAAMWSVQGWEPWNMAWLRIPRGGARRHDATILIEQTVSDFFLEPRNIRLQFFLIAAGAVWPWSIVGLGRLVPERFLPTTRAFIPWWAMVILGVGEAVRGRATALFVLSHRLEREWPALQRSADGAT